MFTDELDTFIIYNERKRVTSSAKKKRRQTDKSLHQVSVFVVNIVECWVVVELITYLVLEKYWALRIWLCTEDGSYKENPCFPFCLYGFH